MKKRLCLGAGICYNEGAAKTAYGRITQLGECHLDKVEVAGSSPVLPTIGSE